MVCPDYRFLASQLARTAVQPNFALYPRKTTRYTDGVFTHAQWHVPSTVSFTQTVAAY